jgi:hypothetical protein
MELTATLEVELDKPIRALIVELPGVDAPMQATVTVGQSLLTDAPNEPRHAIELSLRNPEGKQLGVVLVPVDGARMLAGQLLASVHAVLCVDPSADAGTTVETLSDVGPGTGEA